VKIHTESPSNSAIWVAIVLLTELKYVTFQNAVEANTTKAINTGKNYTKNTIILGILLLRT
jgi:hypothetical protein